MLMRAFRVAVRRLLAKPGYAAVIVCTVALAVGATTAMFSVYYGILLRPLPYPHPDELVVVVADKAFPGGTRGMNFSASEIDDWVRLNRAFTSVALHGGGVYALKTQTAIEAVSGAYVSQDFFSTLGEPLTLGRAIGDDADPVVVISHRLWQRRFASDPHIVGKPITLNNQPHIIIGVASVRALYPRATTDVWLPLTYARRAKLSPSFANRNGGGFQVIARLKRDTTIAEANADVEHVVRVFEAHFDEYRRGMRAHVTPLRAQITASIQPALKVLFAAALLVLVVAAVNVANLMVTRHVAQAREIAVRIALGASRKRVVVESLGQAAVLASAGCAAGIIFALWCVALLRWAQPVQLPRLDDVRIDWPVLAFAALSATAVVLVSSILPALHATRTDVAQAIRAASRTQSIGRAGRRLRSTLVVVELAIAIVLLVGAALLGRSLARLLQTDLGITAEHVLAAHVDVSFGRTIPRPQWPVTAGQIVQRIAAIPGVQSAGVGSGLPPSGLYMRQAFDRVNRLSGARENHLVSVVPATPGYFESLRIRLVTGRLFTTADGAGAPPVIIITDDFAKQLFGDRDPIGETLPIGTDESSTGSTVVGVVRNVKYAGIETTEAVIYRPFAQYPWRVMFFVARTTQDPSRFAADVRQIIRSVDSDINVISVRPVEDAVYDAVAQPRFRTVLISSIAAVTLAIAVIGLYGAIGYSVSQRTNEIGVRMALGAARRNVLEMVFREAGWLIGLGIVSGSVGAYLLTRLLSAFLYGVTPNDPASFAAAAGLLTIVAFAATVAPARRATRIDPVVALRAD